MSAPDERDAQGHAFAYLTAPEVRFLDAAVARLIPADGLGPGAKEAGVTVFIDRQLAGVWGVHGRCYRQGPWAEGTPQQGYQSRLTPQEVYRHAIGEIDAWCARRHGKAFCFLPAELQDAVLRELEGGQIELASVPAKFFFGLLLRNTEEGFFGDPMYGGNRDKAGWKLIGFPGVAGGDYNDWITRHNEPYTGEPVSILDIASARVKVDAQGYPVHPPRARED